MCFRTSLPPSGSSCLHDRSGAAPGEWSQQASWGAAGRTPGAASVGVFCHSDCTDPASWADESRLTTSSFDVEQAPAGSRPFGYFLGEYEGLSNISDRFATVFVAVNNGNPANPTDVFSTTAGCAE